MTNEQRLIKEDREYDYYKRKGILGNYRKEKWFWEDIGRINNKSMEQEWGQERENLILKQKAKENEGRRQNGVGKGKSKT